MLCRERGAVLVGPAEAIRFIVSLVARRGGTECFVCQREQAALPSVCIGLHDNFSGHVQFSYAGSQFIINLSKCQ